MRRSGNERTRGHRALRALRALRGHTGLRALRGHRALRAFRAAAALGAAIGGAPGAAAQVSPCGEVFPSGVIRGPDGVYSLIGRQWTHDARAYTVRYRDHLARLSLFATEPVTSRRVRITQPAGCGPPFEGFAETLRIAELELYLDEDPTRYTRDAAANLLARAEITLTASDSTETLGRIRDGTLATPLNAPFWSSGPARDDQWVEVIFPSETTWNQLVIYWPLETMPAEAFADAPLLEGRRPARIRIEAWRDASWAPVAVSEVRPAERHDGELVREVLDLPFPVTDRMDHARRFERRHELRPRDPNAEPAPEDVVVTAAWSILVEPAPDPLIDLAAEELHAFLDEVMGVHVPVVRASPDDAARESGPAIVFTPPGLPSAIDPMDTHAVTVTPDRIRLAGRGARGVRYAALRVEERMTARRAPFLAAGEETRRPRFSPRIASTFAFGLGPDHLGFPDWYLSLMARHYLDGVYLFQSSPFMNDAFSVVGSPIDPSLEGDPAKRDALRDLVARARRHGLGVYWCLAVPGALPEAFYERHPEVRSDNRGPAVICLSTSLGRELVTDSIGRLVREVPGLAGLVVLRTELNHTCGGRLNCPRCETAAPGRYDPMQRIFGWVKGAAAAADSSLRVIAFDWRASNMPPIYEKFLDTDIDYWVRADTVLGSSPENHIAATGVNGSFFNAVHTYDPARKLWVEIQTTHMFPFHAQPELPVAPAMARRFATLQRFLAERPPEAVKPGIAIGNGSGLWPLPVTTLATRELMWETIPPAETPIDDLARDWYGARHADGAREIWDAYTEIVARARVPKYVSRAALRLPPWRVELDELVPIPPAALVDSLATVWAETHERHAELVHEVPESHRALAATDLTFAAGQRHNLASFARACRWMERFGVATPPDSLVAHEDHEAIEAAIDLLDAELATTHATIRLFAGESAFRLHPYYRNSFGLPVLVEKRRAIEGALARLRHAR